MVSLERDRQCAERADPITARLINIRYIPIQLFSNVLNNMIDYGKNKDDDKNRPQYEIYFRRIRPTCSVHGVKQIRQEDIEIKSSSDYFLNE